jgi:tol-pal system protein YbgF
MAGMHRHWTSLAGAVALAVMHTQITMAAPAAPTPGANRAPDNSELLVRLQRLERDMRDLEAATFRKTPGDKGTAQSGGPVAPDTPIEAAEPPPPVVMPDLNPLLRRLDELEEGLGRVTGQMEEISHQVDLLSQKADRLQKQMDLQAAAQAKSETAQQLGAPVVPEKPAGEVASLDSSKPAVTPGLGAPPSVLGTIPAGTTLPKPADTKREFDAAMNLLSRAKYEEASDAFRAFADAHPDEDRAADALYWTGDIDYSAKKDYMAAARDFAELLKKYPKAQRAPEGMLKLGLALFELGQAKEACAAVGALPAKYPDAAPAILTRAKSVRDEKKCR